MLSTVILTGSNTSFCKAGVTPPTTTTTQHVVSDSAGGLFLFKREFFFPTVARLLPGDRLIDRVFVLLPASYDKVPWDGRYYKLMLNCNLGCTGRLVCSV